MTILTVPLRNFGAPADNVNIAHCSLKPVLVAHYQGDMILWCVRWYLRYPISFAHMAEMAAERGLAISASCIWRWVQVYGPELAKRCRPHLKRTN
jgi:IS6 family transposase